MPYYYKVPAIREYEEEWIEVKKGERLDLSAEIEKDEETGKSYRKVVTDKVVAVRPDFPSGVSYTCKLVGEFFIVKTEKPVRAKDFPEAEALVHSEDRARTREPDARMAVQETRAIEQLRQCFSRGVSR